MHHNLISIVRSNLLSKSCKSNQGKLAELSTVILLTKTKYESQPFILEITLPDEKFSIRFKKLYLELFGVNKDAIEQKKYDKKTGIQKEFIIKFNQRDIISLNKLMIFDSFKRPLNGLPKFIILGDSETVINSLRPIIYLYGSINKEGIIIAIQENFLSIAISGLFKKIGVRVEKKNHKERFVLSLSNNCLISNLFQIICSKNVSNDIEKLFPILTPSSDDENVKVVITTNEPSNSTLIDVLRCRRGIEILAENTKIKKSLIEAADLRTLYPNDSRDELGQKSRPEISKHAFASRIRRFLEIADKVAEKKGIEDTLTFALKQT